MSSPKGPKSPSPTATTTRVCGSSPPKPTASRAQTKSAPRLGDVDNGIPPTLFIFDRCRRLIECLPSLQNDPRRPEDVLKINVNEEGQGGDDTYDALRYALTARRRIQPSFCSLPPPDPVKEADLRNFGSDWDSDLDDIRKLRF